MDAATLPRSAIAGLPELNLAVDLRRRFCDYIERVRARDRDRYEPLFHEFEAWCRDRDVRALPAMGDVAAQYLLHLAQTGDHTWADAVEGAAAITWAHRFYEVPFDDCAMRAVLEYFRELRDDAL